MENQEINQEGVSGGLGVSEAEISGASGISGAEPKKGKKGLVIGGGVAVVVVMAAVWGVMYMNNKPKTEGGATGVEITAEAEEEEEGVIFSLAEYGLDEDATAEEVEAKMIELGNFDPEADYSNDPDADLDSEEYCGDGSCRELAERKGVEVSVSGATRSYSERAQNFIKTAIEYYLTSAYKDAGAATVNVEEGDSSRFQIQAGEVSLSARVITEVNGEELGVSKLTIYNGEGKEVFSSNAEYFEY